MRLECLQVLLGHTNLEVTRRYARLSDQTREEEYFTAMRRIEKENSMQMTNVIIDFRPYLKRRNYSDTRSKIT